MSDPNPLMAGVRAELQRLAPAPPELLEKIALSAAEDFLMQLEAAVEAEAGDSRESCADLAGLLIDAKQGSAGAVWQIIEEYEPHIQRVVRRRLSQRLRSKYDTQDFVQMVWKSFFEEPERLHGFQNSRQLFGFLSKMAQNKVDAEFRRRTRTQAYNLDKEQPLEESDVRSGRPQDSPSQIAIARERWDQLMEDLPHRHQQVVQLRLEGLTFDQIAERLSIDEKTARRVLNRLVDSE